MTYIIISSILLFLVLSICVMVFGSLYKKYKCAYEQEHEKLLGIQEEYSKLVEAYSIKKKNKEKADEKTSALHSGKLSADDILPKRKN